MKLSNILAAVSKTVKKYGVVFESAETQKFSAYFYMILTLVTVSFFGIFAIGPTLNTVSNLNKQYKDNMLVYQALSKKLANIALLDSQYQIIQSSIDNVYAAIPKSSEIPKLTRQLENLANQDGVKITKLTFGSIEIYPNSKKDPIYSFTFNINISGSKNNVNKFLSDIIDFDRIVGVDRIITGTDPENQNTLNFTGRVFFAPS